MPGRVYRIAADDDGVIVAARRLSPTCPWARSIRTIEDRDCNDRLAYLRNVVTLLFLVLEATGTTIIAECVLFTPVSWSHSAETRNTGQHTSAGRGAHSALAFDVIAIALSGINWTNCRHVSLGDLLSSCVVACLDNLLLGVVRRIFTNHDFIEVGAFVLTGRHLFPRAITNCVLFNDVGRATSESTRF